MPHLPAGYPLLTGGRACCQAAEAHAVHCCVQGTERASGAGRAGVMAAWPGRAARAGAGQLSGSVAPNAPEDAALPPAARRFLRATGYLHSVPAAPAATNRAAPRHVIKGGEKSQIRGIFT